MKLQFIKYRLTRHRAGVLLGIISFAILGTALILITNGLSSNASIEPELGAPSKEIVQTTDPLASGGHAIRFTSPSTAETSLAHLASANSVIGAEAALNEFLKPYGMTAQVSTVSDSSYAITYTTYDVITNNDLSTLKTYGALFIQEWSKYPLSFIQFSKVKSVAFTINLSITGTARAAMPDIMGNTMYYDIKYIYSGDYARGVIHHEFDHLFTYTDSGFYAPEDPTWKSLNPSGFVYGNGGASCYLVVNDCLSGQHPIPGFVTGYAASAIEEDKAELFSYLMTGNYYHLLKTWLPGDASLKNKVDNYKQYLASKSPEMSGNYFDTINP